MPRIPYQPADLSEPRDLVTAIRARRGGALINLDRMLLHSPPFAAGWNAFFGRVRGELSMPAKLRELAICGVAVLNEAPYEFHHHAPEFLKGGGTQAQLGALRDFTTAVQRKELFDTAERAVIQLTIEMTRDVQVSDATLSAARNALGSDQHLVEAVGVIATYNMVSRFLVALGVSPEEASAGP